MIKVAIYGAEGKMGCELTKLARNDKQLELVYLFTRTNCDFDKLLDLDLIIDFSTPEASNKLLKELLKKEKYPSLVVGTTGLDDEYFKLSKNYKGRFFWASNTSLGVAILNELVKIAARTLLDFDIEIYEKHHKYKVDAPSGTAITLANNAKNSRSKALNKEQTIVFNRNAKRNNDEIGVVSLRGGSVAGFHSVGFYGEDESVELVHNANSRAIFAKGAIKIGKWLMDKENGIYTIDDFIKELLVCNNS